MQHTIETTADHIQVQLSPDQWKRLRSVHEQAIEDRIGTYMERRQQGEKDPVMDFLFEYYAFRYSHLKRWSPGFGRLLVGAEPFDLEITELVRLDGGAALDPNQFPDNRINALHWILELLEQTVDSSPHFGCFGMHEWAMVYKADRIRHEQVPLRFSEKKIAEFVESRPIQCTHFDAFRFFTPEAKPMNKHQLSRDKFHEMEQPGCLHTNMDLYKWAFKMYPWISSEVIRDAFMLACDTRIIDMKASPYDLRDRGLDPIKIETREGRAEYLEHQKNIWRRSQPVRRQLIEEYRRLMDYFNE